MAQIPALIISTAAGLVVTRVATEQDVGQQLVAQLFGNPMVLALTAGILGILGLIPGMPNLVFLLLASVLGYLAWPQFKSPIAAAKERSVEAAQPAAPVAESVEASWSDVVPVDMLGLEVGYRLIPLVDRGQAGELLNRIRGLRKKFAQEIGFLPAQVHIRDNLELRPNVYRLSLKGVPIGEGEAFPGQYCPKTASGDSSPVYSCPRSRSCVVGLATSVYGRWESEYLRCSPVIFRPDAECVSIRLT